MRFGEYILKLREAKNLSLSVAARELGITPQRLCDIEQGRRNFKRKPQMSLLHKIAAVYDHPFVNLVENTEFFQYEKSLLTELLADLEPVSEALNSKAIEMLVESRRYTPEMEALASETVELTQSLKVSLRVIKSRSRQEPSRASLDTATTRRAG